MLHYLWMIPFLPFVGFAILTLFGRRMPRPAVTAVGVGAVGLSAIVAAIIAAAFLSLPPAGQSFTQTLWTWLHAGNFSPSISLYLDPLSLIMVLVVTFVGFFIHLYSVEFMGGDDGYSRFFAYMNLFVGSMLTLVLADNLLLLYLGWEGVGLCSYLLIGFWYQEPNNGRAARKAFIVTRVGDAALAVGLFLLFTHLGTLNIQELMQRAAQQWPVGSGLAVAASALLLGGAVGKSGQLPLQTWLPDAMAGPTPVSALIHAATMVTAGVYLIARTHVLFSLAPAVELAVAIVGATTLLLAGFSGLTQRDIKRVLAYSTISQIGYMFLALGVGAWSAAIFHFMTHAFFKALLFLGAGVIILALHHEHDLFKMGGLRKLLPFTFWMFFIGALALAGLPPTAGFASKGLILSEAWSSPLGSIWLWLAGLLGVILTSIYTFRMVFLAFWGAPVHAMVKTPGMAMKIPLAALGLLTLFAAALNWPPGWGGTEWVVNFLQPVFPVPPRPVESGAASQGAWFEDLYTCVSLIGIPIAYLVGRPAPARKPAVQRLLNSPLALALHRFWFSGWGFDWIYERLFVRPFVWLARLNRNDFIDWIFQALASLMEFCYFLLKLTQTGRLRWYTLGLALGAILILALIIFL